MKKTYYSQHAQDFLVDSIIKNPKVMIEVGCIDGLRFSNTYYFEKNYDTKCYLFEPHKDYVNLIKRNRPKSIFREYAISNYDNDNGIFYQNYAGTFSNLSDEFKSNYENSAVWGGYEKVENIIIRKLDTCLEEMNIDKIDFLSIDIDGNDILALEGIDLYKIFPTILCIEMNNSMIDFEKYLEHFKKFSHYKYFLVLKQDFIAFKNFNNFLKVIFTFKTIDLFYFKYPFGDKFNKDEYTKIKFNGILMLHKFLSLKYLGYRRFFYRLNKIKNLIFRVSR